MGKNIKIYIKYVIERVLQSVFGVVGRLIPVKQNRILFYSYTGEQYSCSPKYVFEYLKEHHSSDYEFIWAFRSVDRMKSMVSGAKCVKYQSLRFFYYHLSAKCIISNIYPYHLIGTKKNQIMIDTWHGGGAYKIAGFDFSESGNQKISKKTMAFYQNNITAFVSSSELFTKHFIRNGLRFHGDVLDSGLPRNDVFFAALEKQASIRQKVYQALGIPQGKKCFLYAPTYRSEHDSNGFAFSTERLKDALNKRFAGEWVILVRMHRYSSTKIEGDVIDAADYPDMQELLIAADVLVTDYSSSIWDYSLTGKPCFLYTYDLEKYVSKRSFYVDIEKWGFPLCGDFPKLIDAILNFDENDFQTKMKDHYTLLGGYDKGDACKIVANYISDQLGRG